MDYARITIPLKNGSVELIQNIITLNERQIDEIFKQAPTKNKNEWLSPRTKALRIRMTEDQIQKVVDWKNAVVKYLSPDGSGEKLLKSGGIGFSNHAFDRIDERLLEKNAENVLAKEIKGKLGLIEDSDVFVEASSPEVQAEILEVLIHSEKLDPYFEWKVYPHLTFKFKGAFREDIIGIAIALSRRSLIVTITIEERHGFNAAANLWGGINTKGIGK